MASNFNSQQMQQNQGIGSGPNNMMSYSSNTPPVDILNLADAAAKALGQVSRNSSTKPSSNSNSWSGQGNNSHQVMQEKDLPTMVQYAITVR